MKLKEKPHIFSQHGTITNLRQNSKQALSTMKPYKHKLSVEKYVFKI
jgi:hypothetical protein